MARAGGNHAPQGVLDEDRCPDLPEDRDGFEDADGCPELDNDKDGILDRVDGLVFTAPLFALMVWISGNAV